jgi:hypothetical protein
MQYVSTAFAQKKLASLLDAAQSEPVMIQNHDQDIAVMLSPKEYDRLRGINIMEFQQFCDRVGKNAASNGLTEEKLSELLES